jgi:argininosuccinate lyase
VTLDRLPVAEVQALHPGFGTDWPQVFDLKRAMAKRRGTGMPGPVQVRKQLSRWRKLLA